MEFFRKQCFYMLFLLAVIIAAVTILTSYTYMYNPNPWNNYHQYKDVNKTKLIRKISPSQSPENWTCSKQISILASELAGGVGWWKQELFEESFVESEGKRVARYTRSCPKYECNLTVAATLTKNYFQSKSDGFFIQIEDLLTHGMTSTVNNFDAILPKNVMWFVKLMESPLMYAAWDSNIPNILLHYDISYHSLSSVPLPYGYYVPSHPVDTKPQQNWASNKTHLIAWMARNCAGTFWPRTEFVLDLQKYAPVDMYGKCGNLTCLPRASAECNHMLRKYKFYLALENSECDEYITEKFWRNSLEQGVVPVVYGGRKSAYEKLAPRNSFIHVGDFANTQELAKYLLELDQDDEKYNQYFQWRLKGYVKSVPPFTPKHCCDFIPLMALQNDTTKPGTKRRVSESAYFNSCRNGSGRYSAAGSYSDWSPWK